MIANGHLDFAHSAQPDIFRTKTTFEGQVLLNRCTDCKNPIWRTPERFMWSHSQPPRNRLMGFRL